ACGGERECSANRPDVLRVHPWRDEQSVLARNISEMPLLAPCDEPRREAETGTGVVDALEALANRGRIAPFVALVPPAHEIGRAYEDHNGIFIVLIARFTAHEQRALRGEDREQSECRWAKFRSDYWEIISHFAFSSVAFSSSILW